MEAKPTAGIREILVLDLGYCKLRFLSFSFRTLGYCVESHDFVVSFLQLVRVVAADSIATQRLCQIVGSVYG